MNVLGNCYEKKHYQKLILLWNKRDLHKRPLWMWPVQHKQNSMLQLQRVWTLTSQCKWKMCNSCKKSGHIISECRHQPQNRNNNAFHAMVEGSTNTVSTPMPERPCTRCPHAFRIYVDSRNGSADDSISFE
eukprot:TRINITY_DN92016_c0_g1_i1.p1 TRINITY_DN92016_c0_g1~~TRINITY_DN92016_c0_g1_i1.p1  ORF type:complete len:131 (+),score=12.14 TRINITY_DN92016_c0_g1_i1:187-579(+)